MRMKEIRKERLEFIILLLNILRKALKSNSYFTFHFPLSYYTSETSFLAFRTELDYGSPEPR